MELERGLEDQVTVQCSLEKALGCKYFSQNITQVSMPMELSSNLISLVEHFGTSISDHVPETPNKLSEDMVRCMCTVYCKVVDPPLANPCLSSPASSLSSMSVFSMKDQCDICSQGFRKDSSFVIQSSILGCRMSRPGQWLCFYFLLEESLQQEMKEKAMLLNIQNPFCTLHSAQDLMNKYDIWYPMRQTFSLSVRIYTPKRVFQELEAEKQDYIKATLGVKKDQKVVLQKDVESFAKDSALSPAGVMEMIQQSLPAESLRRSIKKIQLGNSHKNIEVPYNVSFRNLIMKERVK